MSDTLSNSLMALLTGSPPLSTRTPGTTLNPLDEIRFRIWAERRGIGDVDSALSHYDYRGFWKAIQEGNPLAVQSSKNGHYPDIWKLPGHPQFSNESKYAAADAPHWEGEHRVDNAGRIVPGDLFAGENRANPFR